LYYFQLLIAIYSTYCYPMLWLHSDGIINTLDMTEYLHCGKEFPDWYTVA